MTGEKMCPFGNPIDPISQNKYQPEIDFIGPGTMPLSIERYYNSLQASLAATNGSFGIGWTSNFDEKVVGANLTTATKAVVLQTKTGARIALESPDYDGPWTTFNGTVVPFSYDPTAEIFTWVDNDFIKIFHKSGRLLTIQSPMGEALGFEYVQNSNPVKIDRVTHTNGSYFDFAYSTGTRISSITSNAGDVWEYEYSSSPLNLIRVKRPAETGVDTVEYDYNSSAGGSLLTGISYVGGGGQYASYEYTSGGDANETARIDSGAEVERTDVDVISQTPFKVRTTKQTGRRTDYTFQDVAGTKRLTRVDGLADSTCVASNSTYTYDSLGYYDIVTDEEGNQTNYDHDTRGKVTLVETGYGTTAVRSSTFTNHPVWSTPTSVSNSLVKTDTELDERGLVEKITVENLSANGVTGQKRITNISYVKDPTTKIVTKVTIDGPLAGSSDKIVMNYDTSGRMTSAVSAVSATKNLTTSYSNFDSYGRAQTVTFPSGLVRAIEYHPRGYVTKTTDTVDGVARITEYDYNYAGDLLRIDYADGSAHAFTYDSARRVKTMSHVGPTFPTNVIEYGYDDNGNVNSTDIIRSTFELVFDPNCNPFFETCFPSFQVLNTLLFSQTAEHDTLNRLTKITSGVGNEREFGYDKTNQLTSTEDGFNRTTSITRSVHLEPDVTTFRDTGTTDVDYDENGLVISVTDPIGGTTTYERDGFGQIWEVNSPATGITDYEYDIAGRLIKKTDARGVVLNYDHDFLGRLKTVKVGSSTTPIQSFTYDTQRDGLLRQVVDEAGTHTFTHNEAGELLSKSSVLNGQTVTQSYTYNNMGQVKTMTYPSGVVATYNYDDKGEVDSITASGGGLSTSNVVTNIDHYPFGPVEEFVFGSGENRSNIRDLAYRTSSINSGTHTAVSYSYDANDNILSFDGRTKTYDNMDRLKTHSGPDGSHEYWYDLNGNRELMVKNGATTDYKYIGVGKKLDEVELVGSFTEDRFYDANGNTTRIDNRYFDYNDLNRFWRYREGSTTVTYKHNAFGERQVKQNGSTVTRFVYDGPSLLYESDGTTTRSYIYLAGEMVGLVHNGVLHFVHNDHLGRPARVTNGSGSTRWQSESNAFGNNPIGISHIGSFNVGFPGQYYDIESGTYYNYNRTYDEVAGRYLQSDPIGLAGGTNTYVYANANPVSNVDAYGLVSYSGNSNPYILNYEGGGLSEVGLDPSNVVTGDTACIENIWGTVTDYTPIIGGVKSGLRFIDDPSWAGALDVVLSLGGGITKGFGQTAKAASGGGRGSTRVYHGTDAASADDIVDNGLSVQRGERYGGDGSFFTTTNRGDAELFSQVNPAGGKPCVVCIDIDNGVLDSLRRQGDLDVDGPVNRFYGDAFETLNQVGRFSKD